ncbi:hypothetical protein QVD99_008276 [Batrachochytrium dendrobatidis]|nr:hypothetical protein QVD99_008276 [Batrachochytrium dendrobatidis]
MDGQQPTTMSAFVSPVTPQQQLSMDSIQQMISNTQQQATMTPISIHSAARVSINMNANRVEVYTLNASTNNVELDADIRSNTRSNTDASSRVSNRIAAK